MTPIGGAADATGGAVLFTVTGENEGAGGQSVIGDDDTATFTYTGAWGNDIVDACFDVNGNDACDSGEPTAQAIVQWRAEQPFADAGGPYTGTPGGAVAISGTLYQGESEFSATWEFSGPGACVFGEADGTSTVTCDTAGTYTLTFTADYGAETAPSDTATLTLTVKEDQNTPPTNDAAGAYYGAEGEPITLAGSASDVDEDILGNTWTITGPGTCTFSDEHSLTSTVTCDTHGYYHLTLTTSDGPASTSDTAAMKIECEPKPVPTTTPPTPTETTPAPTPTTGTTTNPSLPVTGTSLSSVLAAGVLLVALGVAALLFGRVRRTRAEG